MSSSSQAKAPLIRRWLKFYAVGAMGIFVQLFGVYLLGSRLGVDSFWATAFAVEVAVLHNFLWHEHFTWSDRRVFSPHRILHRLLAFNATTGVVSIAGNVLLVSLLLHLARIPLLAANLASIAACSVSNFLINDKFVFQPRNAVSHASQ